MKISEMNNDQAADAMIKIAPAISNLMKDEDAENMIKSMIKAEGETSYQILGGLLPKLVAFCMKDHKRDVYAIVAALTMKPVAEVGKMNFMQTVKELKESVDEEFLGFFNLSGKAKTQPGT